MDGIERSFDTWADRGEDGAHPRRQAAVSAQVESDLEDETGNPAVRLAGTNRYATAVDIAEFALDTLDFPGDDVLRGPTVAPESSTAPGGRR